MPTKISKTYLPSTKEKYMCAKHKKFFTEELLNWKKDIIGKKVESDILDKFINFKYDNIVKLTNIHLIQGKSNNNTYKSQQLELLGLEKPIQKDWKKKVLGKLYNIAIIDKFISYNKT